MQGASLWQSCDVLRFCCLLWHARQTAEIERHRRLAPVADLAMPARKLIVVALVSLAALLAALAWFPRCPFDLQFVRMEGAGSFSADSTKMALLDLRVQNRQWARIEFEDEVQCEAKVSNRWTKIPNTWSLKHLDGSTIRRKRPGTAEMTLLVPAEATACRFRLKYRHVGKRPLPLGIGDPWARLYAPSLLSLRVQQGTARISRPLYDWLWPTNAPERTVEQPGRWRQTTAQVEFQK